MEEKKLDWENLKELKCPKCYGDLVKNNYGVIRGYMCKNCDFSTTTIRLREIVEGMFNKEADNFGRADFEELMENEK